MLVIEGTVYKILFFLGGDMKFLATVCGIEQANAKFPVYGANAQLKRDPTCHWSGQ